MNDKTMVTFEWPTLVEDQLDFVEDHIRKTYSPGLREAIIEGLYNPDAQYDTKIVKITVTVEVTVEERTKT